MRLVTRSDFDGLVCGVLLEEVGVADSHFYCHPNDLQNGKIEVSKNDVLANVPYVDGCGLWFDHHASNISAAPEHFDGAAYEAPSAARVVWDYYGGETKFGSRFCEMMVGVDKVDSANLSKEEVLNPIGWIMLGFIMDPRTGFGRYHHFRISNYQLMEKMVDLIRTKSLEEIFEDPDVSARLSFYYNYISDSIGIIHENCRVEGKTIIFETRNIQEMPVVNRFVVYGLYPECDVSIQVGWGKNKANVSLSVGKSILDRSNKRDIGAFLRKYGGGGHKNAGTCQVALEQVEDAIKDIVAHLNS